MGDFRFLGRLSGFVLFAGLFVLVLPGGGNAPLSPFASRPALFAASGQAGPTSRQSDATAGASGSQAKQAMKGRSDTPSRETASTDAADIVAAQADRLAAALGRDSLPPRLQPRDRTEQPTPPAQTDEATEAPQGALLARPVAMRVDQLSIGEATVVLPGIDPVALSAHCTAGGTDWPCGRMARTALRSFIGLRSIRCEVPDNFAESHERLEATCTVGGQDVGRWIVAHGWARAAEDGPYTDAEVAARRAGRGLWR